MDILTEIKYWDALNIHLIVIHIVWISYLCMVLLWGNSIILGDLQQKGR